MDLIWQIHFGVTTVPDSTIGALRCAASVSYQRERGPRQEDCHPPRHTTGVSVSHRFMCLLREKTVEKSTEKRGSFTLKMWDSLTEECSWHRGALSWKSICLACMKHWVQTLTSHKTRANWSRAPNTSSWETETVQSDVQGALGQLRLCEKMSGGRRERDWLIEGVPLSSQCQA